MPWDFPTYDPGAGGDIPTPTMQEEPFDWSAGLTAMGKELLRTSVPSLISGGVGMGLNALMGGQPQKSRLVDTRTPEQQQASQFGLSRLSSLSQNPSGFGLPGDPNDINTPAGRRTWDIRGGVRSADAARGMFSTGGSAQRETDALNRATADSYNQNYNMAIQGAGGGYPMTLQTSPAQENPWAKLLGGAVSPAIQGGIGKLLQQWGLV